MRAQMKRVFAMLLTAMLVIDSQSSACSSLVSFGAGARNVLAADITEENIDDVDPGSVENVVVTAGDMVSVDFADGAAEDDTSYNEGNEADDNKGDEDAEDAADNEDASVEEDQSVSEDPVSANAFEIQESDTEMTESDLSAASGQEDQSSEEQFEEQTAEGSEAAAADASISDPENTGDEQDDLSIDMPEQTDEEDAAPVAENPEGYEDGGYSEDFEDAGNPEDTENYEEAGDSDGSENYEDPGASGDSENYEDAGDQDEPAGLEEMLERDAAMSDISAEAGEKKEAGQGSVMEREIVDETQESAAEPEMPKLRLKPELRDSFSGFTEVPGLESQIAYAIEQAVAKGNDRTSRTGNVLITGGHGYGKTTIAIGLAKAIAQERGSQYVKMARIYATDLSRKDIAATIAKIAGGVLIIEEAGDLSDQTADQLTTAMEFRTDGLIIIMEDEKKYLVKLLENHPRFGMKFTSQIHLPEYTADELVTFGEVYADDQNYTLSEEARAALRGKIAAQQEAGTEVSISAVVALVENAITRSNKFFRKLFAGKKRFDSMNRIILRDKDFK